MTSRVSGSEWGASSGRQVTSSPRPLKASVVLCTRDRADRLPTALQSLAAMELQEGVEWEVLIIDNGSKDHTHDIVGTFIRENHPRFRYIYEPSHGKTYALNRGIVEAHGEILAFTDDDAIVATNWLAAIIGALDQYGADGVGGKVLPVWQAERPAWLSDEFLNVLALLDLGDQAFRLDWKRDRRMLYGVNYAFHNSVFARLGNFNTALGSRGEDKELFDRLEAADARVFYDPHIVVRHIIPGERLTKAYYRDWYRASGLARAKLEPVGCRSVFGIPLYTLRKGMGTIASLGVAVIMRNHRAVFRYWLWLNFYISYYHGRMRASQSRRQVTSAK